MFNGNAMTVPVTISVDGEHYYLSAFYTHLPKPRGIFYCLSEP